MAERNKTSRNISKHKEIIGANRDISQIMIPGTTEGMIGKALKGEGY